MIHFRLIIGLTMSGQENTEEKQSQKEGPEEPVLEDDVERADATL